MTELNEITDNLDRSCLGVDPELFFVESRSQLGHVDAINLCWTCPVRNPCREYAMERPQLHGVWGGTTAQQRAYLRKHPELAS